MEKNFKKKEWAELKVIKMVSFHPGDSYYILLDSFGNKHLLSAEYYSKYLFKVQDVVLCRVDKINCKGKIFFEPQHPFYKEGEIYDFQKINLKNAESQWIDIFGNICVTKNLVNKKTTRFRVVRIKKSKCYIEQV